jgi:chromatin segregation and condensation protein Rec8/ScpA/Scc1 (kleisin family)
MLELVKGRELVVEQSEPWGPIAVRRADPSAGRPASDEEPRSAEAEEPTDA